MYQRLLDVTKFTPEDNELVTKPLHLCNPYAKSEIREGGLHIWDRSVGIPACIMRKVVDVPQNCYPFNVNRNQYTRDVLIPMVKKIRPIDGTTWLRPSHKYILDLPSHKDGYDILCMASVMAQHEELIVPKGPPLYERIRTWISRIQVAIALELPVFDGEWDWYSRGDMFPPYGIIVTSGNKAYSPSSLLKVNEYGAPVPDKTVIVISVGFNYGTHPVEYIKSDGQSNRNTVYSCSPMLGVIGGWGFIDLVTHMPILDSRNNLSYIIHWEDLNGIHVLHDYIDSIREDIGKVEQGFKYSEFITSDMYVNLYNTSRPHPVAGSLIIGNRPELGLVRPAGIPPPDDIPTKGIKIMYPQWYNYLNELGTIRDIINEASISYERGVRIEGKGNSKYSTRSKRNSNYNKLRKLYDQSKYYRRTYQDRQNRGYLTEAKKYAQKENKAKIEIAELIGFAQGVL